MSQPPDPRVTGSWPSTDRTTTGKIPRIPGSVPSDTTGRLILSHTSTRMPVVIPAEKKKKETSSGPKVHKPITFPAQKQPRTSRRLDKRISWYIILGVALLSIVLGFVFAVPLNNGQQNASTIAQGITNLIQNRNTSARPQGQGQAPGQTQSSNTTPGYPTLGADGTRLFKNSSPWNVPIGGSVQLDSNSSQMVNELVNGNHVAAMFDFGMPIYISTASDPTYRVQDSGGDGTFEANQPIHIPNTAAPSPGSDHWLFIYDKTKNMIFEMWNTNKSGGTWSTQTGNVYSPTGDGVLQVDGSQQSGNGGSYFGGVVTAADMARGYIDHALSLASQSTSSSFRYPMNASDGGGGDIPMGARIQLNPSVNCNTLSGASKGVKMVCQALETYGGYMRDTGGVALSMYFEGENLNDSSRNPPGGSPGNAGNSNGAFGKVGLSDVKSWNSFTLASGSTSQTPLTDLLSGAPVPTFGLVETRSALNNDPARNRRRSLI